MGTVNVNDTSVLIAKEASLGTLPGSPTWETVEFNTRGRFGQQTEAVVRNPISPTDQLQKGEIVSRSSGVELGLDLTMHHAKLFLPSVLYAKPNGPADGLADGAPFRPTAVTAAGWDVAAGGDLPVGTIIRARGFANSENNGVFVLDIAGSDTQIPGPGAERAEFDLSATGNGGVDTVIEAIRAGEEGNVLEFDIVFDGTGAGTLSETDGTDIVAHVESGVTTNLQLEALINSSDFIRVKTASATPAHVLDSTDDNFASTALTGGTDSTLVADAAVADSENATVEICGFQFTAGDLELDGDGNLVTSTKDLTDFGWTAGQPVWVGGDATAMKFATAAYRGWARLTAIGANLATLDKRDWTVGAADDGATKTIQVFYGNFFRNVATSDADRERASYACEGKYPNLDSGVTAYKYTRGNIPANCTTELPLEDKGGMSIALVGTATDPFTTSRATDAANARRAVEKMAMNTMSRFRRLRLTQMDESGDTTLFTSLSLSIAREVTPAHALGDDGEAVAVNNSELQVTLSGEAYLTDPATQDAIDDYTTMTMEFALANDDGAFFVDIPECTLGNGEETLERNTQVKQALDITAHESALFGYSVSITFFPYLPAPNP